MPLLRDVAVVLRDYVTRVDRLGPEALRLRGESCDAGDRKLDRVIDLLKRVEIAAEREQEIETIVHGDLEEITSSRFWSDRAR